MNRRRFLLVGLFILALAARIAGLGRSLWYDELFTLRYFADSPGHALFTQKGANNHPLASLLAFLARQLSEDPRVVRMPFVALGALAVLGVPWLVRRSGGGASAAAAAGLLAVFHPALVGLSQEVRGYALVLLAGPLVAGIALEGRRRLLLGFSVALGLFSHLTLAPLVLGLFLLSVKERAWSTAWALVAGGLGALVLYAPMLGHLGAFAARHGGPDGFEQVLELFTTGDRRLLPCVLAVPVFLLAFLGVGRAPRLGFVVGVSASLVFLGVLVARPVFHARFAVSLLPLILALAGHGAAVLRGRRAVLVVGPLVVVLAVASGRRVGWETEPIGPAVASCEGKRIHFSGLGADLLPSVPREQADVEVLLFATEEEAKFHGLYANVAVRQLR